MYVYIHICMYMSIYLYIYIYIYTCSACMQAAHAEYCNVLQQSFKGKSGGPSSATAATVDVAAHQPGAELGFRV